MVHVLSSSPINVSLTPPSAFVTQKNNFLTQCSGLQKLTLFPRFRIGNGLQSRVRTHSISATGTDVAVEEAGKDAIEALETPSNASDTIEESSVTSNRPRAVRKSEMPPVKNEELIPGATFTGKVRSIQPFGAFVDFGAFTDGLVHVSRLSDSFVKDVNAVVTIGQEVKVKVVEANMETKRISLTMRESDDSSDISRTPRKSTERPNRRNDEINKNSKFVKGQEMQGTVKNLTRSGAFISLPEGDEGFLPTSEEDDEGFGNMTGISSLQVGQEVNVRVLRMNRGKVTLTMKKEEDGAGVDSATSHGVVHIATNPFALAFQSKGE